MNIKDFYKSTEAIVVIGGLLLTILYGRVFAYATAITYFLLNVPNAWSWLKAKFSKILDRF